jgi:hypothetical protein
MKRNPNDTGAPARPPKRIVWVLAAVLIALLVIFAVQGIVRGTGEAVGVREAAPGDTNSAPKQGDTQPG